MTYHKRSWRLVSRRRGKLSKLGFAGRAGLGAGLLAGILSLPLCSSAVRAFLSGAVSAEEPEGSEEDDDVAFPNSAQLKTNAELDRLLAAAEQYAGDKRYDLAARIWQNVLDQTTDTLMTREDKPSAGVDGSKGIDIVASPGEEKWVYRVAGRAYRRYVSINSEIERRLAKLPPEALKLYRIMADGLAKSEMAAAQGDQMEERLASVVRRFFLSSYGDDAAYQLGCLALDRYDFVGASRMFQKVLEEHPDPSIPRHELLARLALAQARVGDTVAAKKAIADLKETVGYDRELLGAISTDLGTGGTETVAQNRPRDHWPIALGSPARDGVMHAPELGDKPGTLVPLWSASYSINQPSFGINTVTDSNVRYGTAPFRVERGATAAWVSVNSMPNRDQVLANWKKNNWHPTSQILLDNGRVYFKTNRSLLCFDSASGELIWKSRDARYAADPVSRWITQIGQFQQQATMNGRPTQPAEVALFGDRVPMSFSIAGDIVLCVEGDPEDKPSDEQKQPQIRSPYGYNVVPRRSRRNLINAHNANTGKYLWTRTLDEGKSSRSETGFIAAPVPYGKLLIVPVSDNGTLWIYALNRDNGETVWKTFLCEDPEGGANSWATTGITVNGGEVYVASGGGVIFAVNATSGNIRWATRYQRANPEIPTGGRRGPYGGGIAQMPSILGDQVGFDEDTVIAHGKQLVVMPSDSSNIFALDRRTGAFLWDSSRGSDRYCLGVVGDILYTGGNITKISNSEQSQGAKEKSLGSVIRGYHISSGKLVIAEVMVNAFSLGRGLVAEDGLYVPVKDSIVKFDLKTGKQISQIGVALPGGEPVGNIVTDGQRFFVAGMERLTAVAIPAEKTKTLQGLAKSDRSRTRLRAARALINAGERQGLQTLVDLLADPDESIRTDSAKMLRIATEQKIEFDPLAAEAARKADRAKWAEWVEGEGQTAPLKTPLAEETEGDTSLTISTAVPPPAQQPTPDPFSPRVGTYSIGVAPTIVVTEEVGGRRVLRIGGSGPIEKSKSIAPATPSPKGAIELKIAPSVASPAGPVGTFAPDLSKRVPPSTTAPATATPPIPKK